MGNVAKAIAGAGATALGSATTYIMIPANVEMPWFGYVLVGVANAALGFAVVYFAPRNKG